MAIEKRRPWSREELLVAFGLYCKLPFGRLHSGNPIIVECARLLQRTPGAVTMKMVNFASLDPYHKSRGISGLRNVSNADRELWNEFARDSEAFAYESEGALYRFQLPQLSQCTAQDSAEANSAVTEREAIVRTRLVQGFFRRAVMAAYNDQCSFCGLHAVELLNASHIIPWSVDVVRRGDPTNGLALCALHDRAFDRGLLGLTNHGKILVAEKLKNMTRSSLGKAAFIELEGKPMTLPWRFLPDKSAIEYHRQNVFRSSE